MKTASTMAFRRFSWAAGLSFLLVSAATAQAQPAKVRAVYPSIDLQYLPAYVAQGKGIFRDEGLDVELIVMPGGRLGVQALVSGDIHFILQLGVALPAIWQGADLKILAQMTNMPLFSLIVRPDIQKPADLKGKKIGVSVGATTSALVHEYLRVNGVDPDKGVEYVNIPGSRGKMAALEKGLIAAAPIAPPGDLRAIQAGSRRLAFFGDLMPDVSFTGLIATGRYIKEDPKNVARMVRAIVRGTYAARDDAEASTAAMQKYMKLTPDEARETFRLVRRSMNANLTEPGVQKMAALVAKSLGVTPSKEPREYMDVSFLNRALSDVGGK
jgi:NitT/TauT family transport system substrate-binding protein